MYSVPAVTIVRQGGAQLAILGKKGTQIKAFLVFTSPPLVRSRYRLCLCRETFSYKFEDEEHDVCRQRECGLVGWVGKLQEQNRDFRWINQLLQALFGFTRAGAYSGQAVVKSQVVPHCLGYRADLTPEIDNVILCMPFTDEEAGMLRSLRLFEQETEFIKMKFTWNFHFVSRIESHRFSDLWDKPLPVLSFLQKYCLHPEFRNVFFH